MSAVVARVLLGHSRKALYGLASLWREARECDEGEAEPNELLVKAATRGLQRALFSPAPGDTLRARVLVRFSLVPRADLSTVSR